MINGTSVSRKNNTGDQLGGRPVELESPKVDVGKPLNLYYFTRRFLKLNWEKSAFFILQDRHIKIVHNDRDSAWKQLKSMLNAAEGTDGVIFENWGEKVEEPRVGFYADKNLKCLQLATLNRMRWDGDTTFDYFFDPENGKNRGKQHAYLFLNGSILTRKSNPNRSEWKYYGWCNSTTDEYQQVLTLALKNKELVRELHEVGIYTDVVNVSGSGEKLEKYEYDVILACFDEHIGLCVNFTRNNKTYQEVYRSTHSLAVVERLKRWFSYCSIENETEAVIAKIREQTEEW